MYSFLLLIPPDDAAPAAAAVDTLVDDLLALHARLLGRCEVPLLVHAAADLAPEVVICAAKHVDDVLLDGLAELQRAKPLPVLMLTGDDRRECMLRAMDAGVHGWAADWPWDAAGDAPARRSKRLAAELHLAHARFTRAAQAQAALADALARLDERKWVERAKGVLMSARGIGEDDAFRLLRGASMHTNLRVADVSRGVIESAQLADAVNRAGQLRMLSQRCVRLLAQCAAAVEARRSRELLDESQQRVNDNLAWLQSAGAPVTAAPAATAASTTAITATALADTVAAWAGLHPLLSGKPQPAALREADARAEALLASAERLTAAIESASGRQAVHLVNLSGRQRMLAQRLAKDALLDALLDDAAARERVAATVQEFGAALTLLERAPLSSADIRAALADARAEWARMLQALRGARSSGGRQALARGSESLLALFERLTEMYEHSLQVIMGG